MTPSRPSGKFITRSSGVVTIEHHGRPRVVVVSAEEWAEISQMRERLRRQEAWEQIKQFMAEASARNADLTQEEADAIADEIGDEAKRRVADRLARQ
jgi:PHD/YefM family antitoxin component YafN of YafNO toxin-antitoxin module